ncbi:MAG: hypothetical protein JXR78_10605 [Victivallales bacterium]|nr:hypothetical protein [Victivallales bacterium]
MEYAKNPVTGKKALRVEWDGNKYSRGMIFMKKTLPSFHVARFELKLTTTEISHVTSCNIRILDADGEMFQYKNAVDWNRKGQWTVNYDVNSKNPEVKSISIPGGISNGNMDKPLTFYGFAFEVPKNSGKGELYIDSIKMIYSNDKRTLISSGLSTPLFDPAEKREMTARRAKHEYIDFENDEYVKLAWNNAGTFPLEFTYNTSYMLGACAVAPGLPEFTEANITVHIKTRRKEALSDIGIIIMDAAGEIFYFSQKVKIDEARSWDLSYNVSPENPACQAIKAGRFVMLKDGKINFPARILGITAKCRKGSSGSFLLGKITMDVNLPLSNAVQFDINTGNSLHILEPEKERNLTLVLKNILNKPISICVSFLFKDFYGNEIKSDFGKLSFKGGETKRLASPLLTRLGIWYVDCHISNPENPMDSNVIKRSLTYMKPAGLTLSNAPEGFIFGINSHPERTPSQIGLEAEAVSAVGAKLIRCAIGCPTKFDVLDNVVEKFSRRGVNFNFIFHYPSVKGNAAEPDFNQFRKRIRTLFLRYKGKVMYWELMNEPESKSISINDYVKLAKIAREELDAIDSNALLLSAGYYIFGKRDNFHRRTIKKCEDIFDYHCFHGHGSFENYAKTIDQSLIKMREEENIKIPWYSNETAISSSGRGEGIQAETLFKKLMFAWSRKSVGYNWYGLRNKADDISNPEMNYGMMTMDFSPKAVYPAYNTITSIYREAEFIKQLKFKNLDCWGFKFKKGDDILVGLWRENKIPEQLIFKTNAKSAAIIDLMGNSKPAHMHNGMIFVPLTLNTITLCLKDAGYLKLCQPFISAQSCEMLSSGRNVPLILSLYNPLDKEIVLDFDIETPEGIKTVKNKDSLTLFPGEKKDWKTTLTADKDFLVKYGNSVKITINYTGNKSRKYSTGVDVPYAIAVPDKLEDKPFCELNKRYQVTSFFEADPANLDKLWSSPDDLSVKAWMYSQNDILYLKINVTDDMHVQPHSGAEVYKGDNLQLYFVFSGQNYLWEIGFSRLGDRRNEIWVWNAPIGNLNEFKNKLEFSSKRETNVTTYDIQIPFSAFGVSPSMLRKDGFKFNLLVNDNDLGVREGWIRLAPGVGDEKISDKFPSLILN